MKQNAPQFYKSNGRLTAYALACGYIEQAKGASIHATLWQEHGVYHVRVHDDNQGRLSWDSFNGLGDAQRRLGRACREFGMTRVNPVRERL